MERNGGRQEKRSVNKVLNGMVWKRTLAGVVGEWCVNGANETDEHVVD